MRISITKSNNDYCPVYYPKKSILSFGAMKKSQFNGIDLMVVEKFKAPIEKFNMIKDFYSWASNLVNSYLAKDYKGKYIDTSKQRKKILSEWNDCIRNSNFYNSATRLFIFNDIIANLKCDNAKLPPDLNENILEYTVFEIENDLLDNPKKSFNFLKNYQRNLESSYIKDSFNNVDDNNGHWLIIPSKENDPQNYTKNLKKLKALSYKTWCTKSSYTAQYLNQGDFHIYIENNKTKLGLSFKNGKVNDLEGILNNDKIPLKYFDICKNYIKDNNLQVSDAIRKKLEKTEQIKKDVEIIKENIAEYIENEDYESIFNYLGYNAIKREDNKLIISHYSKPNENYSFEDLDIDEKKLFKDVVEITGHADFEHSQIVKFENLEKIGGCAYFDNSEIKYLNKLKSIGLSAYFNYSQAETLENIEYIGGSLYLENSKIKSLGKLQTIDGDVDLSSTLITSLENLENINGSCVISFSQLKSLGKLKYIGKNAVFTGIKIKTLENIERVGGNVYITNMNLDSLGKLKEIGGLLKIVNSNIKTLGELEKVREILKTENSKIGTCEIKENIGEESELIKTFEKTIDEIKN